MKIVHVCNGWAETNGAANIARKLAGEQAAAGHRIELLRWASVRTLRTADEVWIHCGWMPCLWWAALWARKAVWVPEACYDPVRLRYHGWKKTLAGPIERWALRRCKQILGTCVAEADWIRRYLGGKHPEVGVTDIKRFFDLNGVCDGRARGECAAQGAQSDAAGMPRSARVLYLGRRHPLKGVEFLEQAVNELKSCPQSNANLQLELRCVSDHFGEELEKDWAWCNVLCLPTLSDNFGLVVAEALERGKRVITTDGAPAWDIEVEKGGGGGEWKDRLVYLRGFRDGTDEQRVQLLKKALEAL